MTITIANLTPVLKKWIREGKEMKAITQWRSLRGGGLMESKKYIQELKKEIRLEDIETRLSRIEERLDEKM